MMLINNRLQTMITMEPRIKLTYSADDFVQCLSLLVIKWGTHKGALSMLVQVAPSILFGIKLKQW